MKQFDLETAISGWKQQLAASGLRRREIVDELESHLREDIADQTRLGTGQRQAFESATARVGNATVLNDEFKKIQLSSQFSRAWDAMLAFAGIPNPQLVIGMNDTTNPLEPRWTTYLRSVAFLTPAVALWMLAMVFITPKLKFVWLKSGATANFGWFSTLSKINFNLIFFVHDHFLLLAAGLVLALGLLECRSRQWPRFRRFTFGTGVFLLNFAVLLSFAILYLAATISAANLLEHAK